MMGQLPGGQERLFYSFNIDHHVPSDHLLRYIDQCLDLDDLRRHLAPFHSPIGRPSIDPELMIRMLIIGYCFGIRSERRLCDEVHLNLAYRWFCQLGLEDAVPNHSTFSKNRLGRFRESDAFRYVFERVLQRCIDEGLVGGEGFAVDASVIKADASRTRGISGAELPYWELDPAQTSRAVREYLEGLDEESRPQLERKNVSMTDPAAEWTCAPGGPAFFAYSTNYLIDVHRGVIVDVEATTAYRTNEVDSTKTMIERVEERFDLKPKRLIGDTAYGTAPMLGWLLQDKEIDPHIPVWDKAERRDGSMSRSNFMFDVENDRYICAIGKVLNTTGTVTSENTVLYRSGAEDCRGCVLKPRCCPNTPSRRIPRSIFESARDKTRAIAQTGADRKSRCERKKVEMLFAHLKRILKVDRLRLRGLHGARDEFLLAATAQNLRRMARQMMPIASISPA